MLGSGTRRRAEGGTQAEGWSRQTRGSFDALSHTCFGSMGMCTGDMRTKCPGMFQRIYCEFEIDGDIEAVMHQSV